MAPSRRVVAALVMVVVVAAAAVKAVEARANVANDMCPSVKTTVYPFAAKCGVEPAVYFGKEKYTLGVLSIIGTIWGDLAPEWDESNATFYVRSAREGAKYAFAYRSKEVRNGVSQSDDVIIYNTETGRSLGWRQEGENEWFLVEVDDTSGAAATFQLARAPVSSFTLCRFVDPNITCEFYYILDYNASTGLSPYVEDGVIYFTRSSKFHQPFGLFRSSSNAIPRSLIA